MLERSRLAIVAVVLVALTAASGCAGSTQAAIRVNDREMSRADLNDLFAELAPYEQEIGVPFAGPRDGLIDLVATSGGGGGSFAIRWVVQDFVMREILADAGDRVTEEDEQRTAEQYSGDFSAELTDLAVRLFSSAAAFERVTTEQGLDPQQVYSLAFTDYDVELDPRYGEYVDGQYLPPAG